MPTQEDNVRSLKQAVRFEILSEDFEERLIEWMAFRVDPARLAQWGPPDTSSNVLSDMCRQFSTPGLYGVRPVVFHADAAADPLIEPGGHLDRAGYWTMMQWVQYLTLGMGDWFVRADATSDGLSFRLVNPANIWVWATQDRPDKPVILWELRVRAVTVGDQTRWTYAWDQYDLGLFDADGVMLRAPSYRVVEAGGSYNGKDITNLVLSDAPVNGYEGMEGKDAYPFVRNGRPFIPGAFYRAVDSKQTWNHLHKVGATRGTLNAATHWTYAGHCARDASGTAVIASGLVPIMGNQNNIGDPNAIATIQLSPGAILYHEAKPDTQPFVQEVGPGGNLEEVSSFAHAYEAKQLARWGISSDDVQKSSADPASGAAMYISNASKRQYSKQVEPLFRSADLEMLSVCAALLQIVGIASCPTEGYSISYSEIPRSPAEEQAVLDQIDWDLKHGHISEVQAYMRRHPGTREQDAIAAITKAAVDKARLEQAQREAFAAEGIEISAPTQNLEVGKVTAAQAIVVAAAASQLPAESAKEMLISLIGISAAAAEAILAPVRAQPVPTAA